MTTKLVVGFKSGAVKEIRLGPEHSQEAPKATADRLYTKMQGGPDYMQIGTTLLVSEHIEYLEFS